jgi:hypothetical protein
MTDLRPIEELSDKHLAAMSAKARPSSDLEAAKDEVFSLEIKLREATTTHNKTFRPGMTDAKAMQSQLAIDRIKEQLLWARRDLEGRQKYTDHLAAHDAREANAHLPKNRLFAVKDEHGRIIRHRAASQAQLTGELTPGYTIVAEVSALRATARAALRYRQIQTRRRFLRGSSRRLAAELLAWLAANGVTVRRT